MEPTSDGMVEPTARPNRPVLVFRESPYGNTLVFAPIERAQYVDRLHRAISTSQTWGEFRRRMPHKEYEKLFADSFTTEIEQRDEDDGLCGPADNEPFSPDAVPGFSDGDYPPWIAAEQDLYLPREVLGAFGVAKTSVLNGFYWAIDAGNREQVLTALEISGYHLIEREDLQFW